MIGTTEINQARAGARIAFVTPTWEAAHEELERLAELAGDDATITRTKGNPSIGYTSGGIRIISAGSESAEHDATFDVVIVRADAYTDDLVERYAPTIETTNGSILIDGEVTLDGDLEDTSSVIVCPECGAQLADTNSGATIRHEANGGHAYQQ